jgi:transposase
VAAVICGVDVSSKTLEARIGLDGPHKSFSNTPAGIEALAEFCRTHQVDLVAMEASGGYEKQPFTLLWMHQAPAAIVNPRAVRRFAEAMGFLEKTDSIDAGVIARFAEVKRIQPMAPASLMLKHLSALVTRLRQLTELKTAQTNQGRLVTDAIVRTGLDELQALLNRQIRSLEAKIAELIDADPLWSKLDETFRSLKGIAGRTTSRLMAELPEIGTISNKAISKLVGYAPIANDSGNHKGKRSIRGGRTSVRSILFVVSHLVCKYDPDFAAFRQRLIDAGKPKMVVRTAVAHKLLVRLNAKARDARKELALAT